MGKNTRTLIIIVVVIAAALAFNSLWQGRYTTSSETIFTGNPDDIVKFTVNKNNDTINLTKTDGTWSIVGVDSMVVRQNRLDNLFNNVLATEHATLVSKNPDKWHLYSVDDSLGTRLRLYNTRDKLLGDYYFGRSKTDWSHNNFRNGGEDEVYLTNANVLYHLNATTSFWGEKPKPPEPDTTAVMPAAIPTD